MEIGTMPGTSLSLLLTDNLIIGRIQWDKLSYWKTKEYICLWLVSVSSIWLLFRVMSAADGVHKFIANVHVVLQCCNELDINLIHWQSCLHTNKFDYNKSSNDNAQCIWAFDGWTITKAFLEWGFYKKCVQPENGIICECCKYFQKKNIRWVIYLIGEGIEYVNKCPQNFQSFSLE